MTKDFARDIQSWTVSAQGLALETLHAAAREAGKRVIERTPHDTGHARANWTAAAGEPDTTVTPTPEPQSPDAATQTSLNRLDAALADWNPQTHSVFHIANSVPYIGPLEYGHSGQAPHGMVRLTASEWSAIVATARGSAPEPRRGK